MKILRLLYAVVVILAVGNVCFRSIVIADQKSVRITLISHANMSRWVKDESKVRWYLAISKEDIATTQVSKGITYNVPVNRDRKNLKKYIVTEGVGLNQPATIEIEAGIYDWLILVDHDGDGSIDGWHGTRTDWVRQDGFEFQSGKHYKIIISKETTVQLVIE